MTGCYCGNGTALEISAPQFRNTSNEINVNWRARQYASDATIFKSFAATLHHRTVAAPVHVILKSFV